MPLRAAIDLGTNTCLLVIVDSSSAELSVKDLLDARIVEDHMRVVRLGEGVGAARALQPEPIRRALECLKGYAERIRIHGMNPAAVRCVATAQARDAQNGADFFAQVEHETGFHFRVISGEEEARLSFEGGLLPRTDPERAMIIDIGGGSTEIVSKECGISIPIGSVKLTERFFGRSLQHPTSPVTDTEFWACRHAIDERIQEQVATLRQGLQLIGVAGTVTTIAQWQAGLVSYEPSQLDGMELTRGDIHRAVEEFKWRSPQERRLIAGMDPKRADVILAGALILWRTMELLGFADLRVSTRGLRFGALTLAE